MTIPITRLELKNKLPAHCFEKNTLKSFYYLLRDFLFLFTAFYTYPLLSGSWLGLICYWIIYGFLMWCLFVIGHDCGHQTFSRYRWINDICGHLCHGVLLVPYWPWAYSHKKHHLFHNHIAKDHSHPWLTKKEWRQYNLLQKLYIYSPTTPFIAYFFYLYIGLSDGSHINPFSKLYNSSAVKDKLKCFVSTIVVLIFLCFISLYSHTFKTFMTFYGGCWFVFAFWLFMVTYMQHHKKQTILFDDSNWTFLRGALETIDRRYGFGIDNFHHNISDCHVAHHLFFNSIPHYHLKEATNTIQNLIRNSDIDYQCVRQPFFLWDFFKLFFTEHYRGWKIFSDNHSSK